MPLRSGSSPLLRRLFHSSTIRRADSSPDHYATLQIPTNATPSDVKKSFYFLSKTHHPDRNPNDPDASARFVKISEAYNILGTPAKRQQYDRDFLRASQPVASGAGSHARPTGSYHSSGPAGGRPASGLSRRRTQFQGPPPSFYRSGGWGQYEAKRQAAQGGSTGNHEAQGMGSSQRSWGGHMNDVPHFDRESHFRTQEGIHSQHEKRRQRQRKTTEEYVPDISQSRGMLVNFVFVGSIVSFAVFVPSFFFGKTTKYHSER